MFIVAVEVEACSLPVALQWRDHWVTLRPCEHASFERKGTTNKWQIMLSAHPESAMWREARGQFCRTQHAALACSRHQVSSFYSKKNNRLKTQHAYWEFNNSFRLPGKRRSDDATSLYSEFLQLQSFNKELRHLDLCHLLDGSYLAAYHYRWP